MEYREIKGFDYPYFIFEDNEIYTIMNHRIFKIKVYKTKNNKEIVYLKKGNVSNIFNPNKLKKRYFQV
jgi:hypothetical protein